MTKEEEEKRREEILKSIKKARRRSFKYIEWKILGYIVAVVLLFSISYNHQAELERFLNPIYYAGAEQNSILPIQDNENSLMKVHFIDVGCADATFIELPDNKTMLIDCAGDLLETTNSINALMQYLKVEIYSKRENKILDYLVISHPDKDHYSGVKDVLREYEVQNIIRPIVLSESEFEYYSKNEITEMQDNFTVKYDEGYEELISLLENELKTTSNSKMFFGRAGLDLSGQKYELEFIAPNEIYYEDEWNNFSSCIRLECFGKVFIFMADAEKELERELIEKYSSDIGYLKADILKIGHHGSETSSSHNFLYAVSPDYFVASTRNGVYSKIPADSILTSIEATFPKAQTLRTDLNGNLIFSITDQGNVAIYSTRGSFDFVTNFVYIQLHYVLISISVMLFVLVFQFRGTTRGDILEMRKKKYEKEKKKMKKLAKKEVWKNE